MAINNGGRLLTVTEVQNIFANRMGVPYNPSNSDNNDYSIYYDN